MAHFSLLYSLTWTLALIERGFLYHSSKEEAWAPCKCKKPSKKCAKTNFPQNRKKWRVVAHRQRLVSNLWTYKFLKTAVFASRENICDSRLRADTKVATRNLPFFYKQNLSNEFSLLSFPRRRVLAPIWKKSNYTVNVRPLIHQHHDLDSSSSHPIINRRWKDKIHGEHKPETRNAYITLLLLNDSHIGKF